MPALDYFIYHGGTENTENQTPCPPCLRGENLELLAVARTYDPASKCYYQAYSTHFITTGQAQPIHPGWYTP